MKKQTLKAISRKESRKGYTKQLRRDGKIPSVIYGHTEPLSIAVDEHEFNSKFKTISENVIITLSVDSNSYDVLVKDFQEDILSGKIVHLDFYEIEKGKLLKTHVPLHTTGTCVGVREGGIFELLLHEVEIECLPKDLPEDISIDVTGLAVGHSIHVRELEAMEGVKILNPPEQVICLVTRKREEKAAVEEEITEGAVTTESTETSAE